jgi:hypothetical protein
MNKTCRRCGQTLPANKENFYIRKNGKCNEGKCRACLAEIRREKYAESEEYREQNLERSRAWRKAHPHLTPERKAYLRNYRQSLHPVIRTLYGGNDYGITPEQYDKIKEMQGGVCYICGLDRRLVIDHDHEHNVVRGLICQPCNGRLGWLEPRLKLITDYIKRGLPTSEWVMSGIVGRVKRVSSKVAL